MQTGILFPNWLSPEIFTISLFGWDFPLRWYALAYIVGILIAWRIIHTAVKRPHLWRGDTSPMTTEQVESLLTWIVVGVILGGRIGYVLFYRPSYYFENWTEIPLITQGGMAFHGGFLGVVVAIIWFCRRNAVPLAAVSDSVAMTAPIGIMLGRMANFVNAELWGRPTDAPWGVIFPGEAAQSCATLTTLCARHPSQLYEAALEGLFLGTLLLWIAIRRGGLKKSWLISGLFFIVYGAARFIVEFVRQPDVQFVSPDNPVGWAYEFGGWGLTQGQALSLPMILIGLIVVLRARRA